MKKIYLTFDDGPLGGTLKVLTAVKQENIPASFFIVGQHVVDSPGQTKLWKQMKADNSIELCNHSFSHANNKYCKFYKDPGKVVKDIMKNNEQLGLNNAVVRMPGRNAWRIGNINRTDVPESKAAIDAVQKAGFDVLGWDLEWKENTESQPLSPPLFLESLPDVSILLKRIKDTFKSGSKNLVTPGHLVLLTHDQFFKTDEDIGQLIYLFRALKNNADYELAFASTYPGLK
jgi:peptidoglycan/xylan/chitin deacetylase (PgdA/CDA1 family)